MTKKKLKILERCFEAEINYAISTVKPNGMTLPICQLRKSNDVAELEEQGMIQYAECKLSGRFPVTIAGHILTELGRMTYCSSC